jgi:hypothetical protein
VASVLWDKQICLASLDISQNFKLLTKGIAMPMREVYNEEWSKYFEVGKKDHYKHD